MRCTKIFNSLQAFSSIEKIYIFINSSDPKESLQHKKYSVKKPDSEIGLFELRLHVY